MRLCTPGTERDVSSRYALFSSTAFSSHSSQLSFPDHIEFLSHVSSACEDASVILCG
ncbi:hypothetical protein M378DRAFT_166157 [Amanita muscaria Koide BX008]|uniref:Uncharacterized protein n=1 Tax=Amanita muscaria (strain Koide BX008) TaxID=946122 RepID=A0A0C2WYV0_AMAMK|nr:hypothetical protein M378DRAFT_166157 [Amanita muscaria Koide BX008]